MHWQSGARSLHLLELTLGRHLAIQSELHAITPALDSAYKDLCGTTCKALDALADRVDGKGAGGLPDVNRALTHLERELSAWYEVRTEKESAERVSGILATARQIATIVLSGGSEIQVAAVPSGGL